MFHSRGADIETSVSKYLMKVARNSELHLLYISSNNAQSGSNRMTLFNDVMQFLFYATQSQLFSINFQSFTFCALPE